MAIENPTHINDLNPLWPDGAESPQGADNHLRLIKKVLIDDLGSLEGAITLTADEINGLVQGVADAVEKAGDFMTGDLLMTNYKGVEFALAEADPIEDTELFGRVVGRDDHIVVEVLDTDGTVLNSMTINEADITLASVAIGVTPDGTVAKELITVDYLNQILIVEDRKATGTTGGASVSGWNKRSLQTVIYNGITDASLADNDVTLPVGTYIVEGSAPAYKVDRHSIRLVDSSGPTTLLIGTAEKTDETSTEAMTRSFIEGVIILTAETVLYIEHYTTHGDSVGLGVAGSMHGAGEVYSRIKFTKI